MRHVFTHEELVSVRSTADTSGQSREFQSWLRLHLLELWFERKRRKLTDYLKRWTAQPLIMMPDHMNVNHYMTHLK